MPTQNDAPSRASDDVAELRRLAELLGYPPDEWRGSWQDLFHGLRRVRTCLRDIADRLEQTPPRPPVRSSRWGLRPKRERQEAADRAARARRVLKRPEGQSLLPL